MMEVIETGKLGAMCRLLQGEMAARGLHFSTCTNAHFKRTALAAHAYLTQPQEG